MGFDIIFRINFSTNVFRKFEFGKKYIDHILKKEIV